MEKIRIAIIALLLLTTKTLGDPIHTAAKTGNLAGVKAEIEDGEDVDIPNLSNFDLTPLHYAAAYGHLEILDYLIQEGLDFSTGRVRASFWGNRLPFGYAYSGKMNKPAPGSRELKSIESLNRIGIYIFHTALLAAPARGARRGN